MDIEFWSGLGLGAFGTLALQKIFPIILKAHFDAKKEKKKIIIDRSGKLCDEVHKLVKAAISCYCLDYNRSTSVSVKSEFQAVSVLINELNKDLIAAGYKDMQVESKIIIDMRQAITGKLLELRTDRYNFSDMHIIQIDRAGEIVLERLREISRQISF